MHTKCRVRKKKKKESFCSVSAFFFTHITQIRDNPYIKQVSFISTERFFFFKAATLITGSNIERAV